MPSKNKRAKPSRTSAFCAARAADIRQLHSLYSTLPSPFFVDISGPTPGLSLPAFTTYCKNEAALYVQHSALGTQHSALSVRAFFLLCYIQPELEMANLDFAFFDDNWQDNPADRSAFSAALKQAFFRKGISRVQVLLLTAQTAKIAFVEALGFKREGVLREHFYHDGKYRDLFVYAFAEQRKA